MNFIKNTLCTFSFLINGAISMNTAEGLKNGNDFWMIAAFAVPALICGFSAVYLVWKTAKKIENTIKGEDDE